MQVYTREMMMESLLAIPPLVDLYARKDPAFVQQVMDWMSRTEKHLSSLRHPLTATMATERGRILAALDGHRPPEAEPGLSARKLARATASTSLETCERKLHEAVQAIDMRLQVMREKLVQLLAVSSAHSPIPLPPTEPRSTWLAGVWKRLRTSAETQSLQRYIEGSLDPTDRLHLLDEVLRNLLGERAVPV